MRLVMETKAKYLYRKSRSAKSGVYIAVLLVNVFVLTGIGAVYAAYTMNYRQKLFTENINNVENLSAASANAACTYVRGMGVKIDDIVNYIRLKDLSADAAVRYLGEANTDPDVRFQLVLCGSYGDTGKVSFGDYSGISVRKIKKEDGSFETREKKIIYGSGYYDIRRSFTDAGNDILHNAGFALEFTDPDTKRKCFAVCRHVVLKDGSAKTKLYTVLLVVNSQTALNAYNMHEKYDGQSTVLINKDGDYIIKNSDYRNVNFYDYIVNYNGLTLDRKALLQKEVADAASGGKPATNLFYKNHKGYDCVFSVAAMNNGWHSVTCVPLSSFDLEDEDVNYSLIILLLFLALFVLDGAAIYSVGKAMSYNVTVAELATEEANRANQAKSRFLSTMSHELRTPLNAIIGFASLAGDHLKDPTLLGDYLKKINISSKLLLQLISDILDISAIESGKMKISNGEFDIARLISSLSAIYYDQCSAKGVEFNVVLKNIHSETLVGDSVRVNQVLLNFLSNAVKFTPKGGSVTLKVETVKRENTSVTVRFDVTDTGCGISGELQTRLFEPFERADGDAARRYGGTGLGLSIAKNLTQLMNGQIGVESREGVGSRFWVELPFAAPGKQTSRSFSPIKGMRAVVAVNNACEREYIGQILSNVGVAHSLAENAEAALKLLREEKSGATPFDLCILDWKMSDLNSVDATKKIRGEFDGQDLRIMVLAYDIAEAKQRSLEAGADLILGKPLFSSALYNVLEEMSAGQVRTVPDMVPEYDLHGKRVLLVEDNAINAEIASLILTKFGLDVETAENGRLGCESFAASAPGYFDAILMDIQMPVMNGYQAAAAIRACSHPDAESIPILAMTADIFSDDVERSRAAGMNEHISKPIDPHGLYLILKKYLS